MSAKSSFFGWPFGSNAPLVALVYLPVDRGINRTLRGFRPAPLPMPEARWRRWIIARTDMLGRYRTSTDSIITRLLRRSRRNAPARMGMSSNAPSRLSRSIATPAPRPIPRKAHRSPRERVCRVAAARQPAIESILTNVPGEAVAATSRKRGSREVCQVVEPPDPERAPVRPRPQLDQHLRRPPLHVLHHRLAQIPFLRRHRRPRRGSGSAHRRAARSCRAPGSSQRLGNRDDHASPVLVTSGNADAMLLDSTSTLPPGACRRSSRLSAEKSGSAS